MGVDDDFDLDDQETYTTSCPRCGMAELVYEEETGEYYHPVSGKVHKCPAVKVSAGDFEGD